MLKKLLAVTALGFSSLGFAACSDNSAPREGTSEMKDIADIHAAQEKAASQAATSKAVQETQEKASNDATSSEEEIDINIDTSAIGQPQEGSEDAPVDSDGVPLLPMTN
ncbi:MAG: hypothetical protein J6M18_05745 [Actinomycetaceae bacterium]|nr:hypothetical protein [Actinomycetaceae bacterium]